jgi:CHAD domain-containing protein
VDEEVVRRRAFEISQGALAGTAVENWLAAEREFAVAHDYDTLDGDLERLGLSLSRLPGEAGVVWRLVLARGECVAAWEPGNGGLVPPAQIAALIVGVVAGKELVSGPPASSDPGVVRLREMLVAQRQALQRHDPGSRLGSDPENLHQHRVAARRARAFLRATRAFLEPGWQQPVVEALRLLGEATGPVRDLDVLIEHLRGEVDRLEQPDRRAAAAILARLERERRVARDALLTALESARYRFLLRTLRQPPRLAAAVETVPLQQVARSEFARLVKAVRRLSEQPDAEAIHRLRITLKRARYTAELAAPPSSAARRFLADARLLQDLLGEHQDATVAAEHLRSSFADDPGTAAAFLAGRLAERQLTRRAQANERLPAAWKRLRKSGRKLH